MKLIIVVALALVAAVSALPVQTEEPPQILRSDVKQETDGSYKIAVETENGIIINEDGEAKEVLNEDNKPQKVIVVRGSYSYIGEDGKTVSITYTADEFGFHPQGDSIPTLPTRR